MDDATRAAISRWRLQTRAAVHGQPGKLIVIAGPRELKLHTHSRTCALWLRSKREIGVEVPDRLKSVCSTTVSNIEVMMNLNVCLMETTRSTLSQPYFLTHGLVNARMQLVELAQSVPLIGNIEDPIAQVYFEDLFALGLVPGACSNSVMNVISRCSFPVAVHTRPAELHTAHELISMLHCPRLHLGLMSLGQVGVIQSQGNDDVVLVMELLSLHELDIDKMRHRVLIDVGLTTSHSYKCKSDVIKNLLNSKLRPFILGFIIDSGDIYAQPELDAYLNDENEEIIGMAYSSMSSDVQQHDSRKNYVGKFMIKSFVSSYSKISSFVRPKEHGSIHSHLYYADKLINDIDAFVL